MLARLEQVSTQGAARGNLAERGGFFPPLKAKDFGSSRFRALPISHRSWENSIPET